MIDWEESFVIDPPFTKCLSNETLLLCIDHPIEIPDFPCHNQAVERTIKLLTETLLSVTGEDSRHGSILSTITRQKRKSCFLFKTRLSLINLE